MKTNKRNLFSKYIETSESLILPFSNNRYIIKIDGQVIDTRGKTIETSWNNNKDVIVKLDWYDGEKFYLLAEVIIHTFKPVSALLLNHWKLLNVLFADNNRQNLHPSNLVWKFPVGLGSDTHNGFAFIPMFSRYMINLEGAVYDTRKRRIMNGQYTVGYHSYILIADSGTRTSLKQHRGIMLAFTDYPNNVDSLDVNHKNGICNDNNKSNLEWCTPSDNIKHAFKLGLRTNELTPVLVRDTRNGIITEYESIVACSRSLGINLVTLNSRLRSPTSLLNPDRLQFKRKKDLTPWYISDDFEKELLDTSWKKEVLLLNLSTGEVTKFSSQRELSTFFGFVEAVFSRWLREADQRVYKKGDEYFIAKHIKDNAPWRIVDDPEMDYIVNTLKRKPILSRYVPTNEIVKHSSAADCARALGILTTTLNYRLTHRGQKMFDDGFQVKYFDEPLPFSEINNDVVSILRAAPLTSNSYRTTSLIAGNSC